jgi:hypothetical protein
MAFYTSGDFLDVSPTFILFLRRFGYHLVYGLVLGAVLGIGLL